jgi:serine/threonine-protein kinase
LTDQQRDEVEHRLHQARQLGPDEGVVFAEQIGDAQVRGEVLSLLAAEAHTAGPSVGGIIGEAARSIAGELEGGHIIAHFQIIRPIGSGGMGEVYLATDLHLRREVALKVLPAVFQQNSDRLRRFEREARAAAALNHPNVMAIYEVVRAADQSFIAAEYVEGETLSQRLSRGPLAEAETLRVALQIAEALGAAHEKGIVHRDLKPANIKIKPDGTVKVLDFGLAKLPPEPAPRTTAEALTIDTTGVGAILGTAAYMSPEQARGLPVDKRTDIWSYGIVLYEMLTGNAIFQRETITDTLAAVVKDEPDLSRLPARLRRVLRRCLQKDMRHRWQDIGDVRMLLEEDVAAPVAEPPSSAPWKFTAVACLAALAVGILLLRPTRPAPKPLVRMNVDLGPDTRLANDRGQHAVAISPDGMRIAFACAGPQDEKRICTRRLDQGKAVALPGTEGVEKIFFSPDGKWIGFGANGKLKKVSADGGAPFTLCNAPFDRGAAWGTDGFLVAALVERAGLMRIPENGGAPQVLTELKPGENTHRWPQVLPDGKGVLFTANSQPGDYENASIDVVSFKTRERRTLHRGGYHGRYLPSGHLVYMHRGTLFAVRMDLDRLTLTGPPAPLLEDVASRAGDGGAAFDFSQSGVFVYDSGGLKSQATVQWLEQSGKLQPLLGTPSAYKELRFSPDGKRLALVVHEAANPDLWVYDLERGTMTRLTFGGANEGPVWGPGGQYLAYHSGHGLGLWWIRADGSGKPQPLVESKLMQAVTSVTASSVAFEETSPAADQDIWAGSLEGAASDHPKAGKPEPFLRTPASEGSAAFSPDGRWLAYTSDESGSYQVYVRPFRPAATSEAGGKWQISTEGGTFPIWSPKGRELFYTSRDRKIMVTNYSTNGDLFTPGKPVLWCDFQVATNVQVVRLAPSTIDLAPDGKRFAVIVPVRAEYQKPQTHVNVLFNFFDEVRRRTPRP